MFKTAENNKLNYIHLINRFWDVNLEYNFTGNEAKLYFYLIHVSNSLCWKNPFRNSLRQIQNGTGISINSIKTAQNRLAESGLIFIKVGNPGNRFDYLNKTEYYLSVSISDTATDTQADTGTDTATDTQADTINKLKETKQIKKDKKKVFLPPSRTEFINYFIENGYDPKVAERAFDGYDVAGWADSKGNKIKNWQQKCQHVWFKTENQKKPTNGFSKYGLVPGQLLLPENEIKKQKILENAGF